MVSQRSLLKRFVYNTDHVSAGCLKPVRVRLSIFKPRHKKHDGPDGSSMYAQNLLKQRESHVLCLVRR